MVGLRVMTSGAAPTHHLFFRLAGVRRTVKNFILLEVSGELNILPLFSCPFLFSPENKVSLGSSF